MNEPIQMLLAYGLIARVTIAGLKAQRREWMTCYAEATRKSPESFYRAFPNLPLDAEKEIERLRGKKTEKT